MEKDTLVNIIEQEIRSFKLDNKKSVYSFNLFKGNNWQQDSTCKKIIEDNKYNFDSIVYVLQWSNAFTIFYSNYCICKDYYKQSKNIRYKNLNLVFQSCGTKVNNIGKYEYTFDIFYDFFSELIILKKSFSSDWEVLTGKILKCIFEYDVLPSSSYEKMDYYLKAYRDITKKYGESYFDVLNACVNYAQQYDIYSDELDKYSGDRDARIADTILYGDNKKLWYKQYYKYALKSILNVSKKAIARDEYKADIVVFNMAKPYLFNAINSRHLESYSWYFIWVNSILLHANKAKIEVDSSFYDEVNSIEDKFYSFLERNEIYYIDSTTGEIERTELAQGAFDLFYRIGNLFYKYPKIRNYNKVLKWFEFAIKMDNAEDNENYADIRYFEALCLRDGLANVELNRDRMVEYLKEGASREHAGCEYELYKYYAYNGDSYSADIWKKKAALHGIKSDEDNERYKQGVLQKTSNIIGTISSIAQGVAGVAASVVTVAGAISALTDIKNK